MILLQCARETSPAHMKSIIQLNEINVLQSTLVLVLVLVHYRQQRNVDSFVYARRSVVTDTCCFSS